MIRRRDALRRGLPALVAIGGGIGLGACRQQPVYESTGGQFPGTGDMAAREALIRRALAAEPGWSAQPMAPGLLRASNRWNDHQMTVDIAFDIRSFTIRYAGSVNLDYDGVQVHQAYNERVRALEAAILRGG